MLKGKCSGYWLSTLHGDHVLAGPQKAMVGWEWVKRSGIAARPRGERFRGDSARGHVASGDLLTVEINNRPVIPQEVHRQIRVAGRIGCPGNGK